MSLTFGIVGTGFIAEAHATALAGLGRSVHTVVDTNPAAAEGFARRWSARPAVLDELLADPDVDAVLVCTPNHTHATLARQVAAAGKHLLLEKPMALSLAEAVTVRDAFAAAGRVLMVGHTHRHTDVGRLVAHTLASGSLGTVRSLRLAITGGWIWGDWNAWVLDPARSGGHAFHNGVHLFDLAAWWLGAPVVSALAVGQRLTSSALRIDDYLCATLTARSGAAAVCEISRGEQPRTTSLFELVVHGDRGSLVRQWSSDGLVAFTPAVAGPRPAATSDPFARQLRRFCAAVEDDAPPDPSPEDALHATAVAEAVQASVDSGRAEAVASW